MIFTFSISKDENPRESLLIRLLCILLGVLRLHKHFCNKKKREKKPAAGFYSA